MSHLLCRARVPQLLVSAPLPSIVALSFFLLPASNQFQSRLLLPPAGVCGKHSIRSLFPVICIVLFQHRVVVFPPLELCLLTKTVFYFRNSHPHGSHYNPIMQQPALLTGHVTLPSNQTLNVGVAHVMRQPSTNNNSSSKKSKQHQTSSRYLAALIIFDSTRSFHSLLGPNQHRSHLFFLPLPFKARLDLRGLVLPGGPVAAALQAGEREHAPSLRRATERLGLQLPAHTRMRRRGRVGGQRSRAGFQHHS